MSNALGNSFATAAFFVSKTFKGFGSTVIDRFIVDRSMTDGLTTLPSILKATE